MHIVTLVIAHACYLSHVIHSIKQTFQGQIGVQNSVYNFRFFVPPRLHSRWSKHMEVQGKLQFKYKLSKILKMTNVPSKEFAKCWEFIKKNTTHEELFCLLKDGFSLVEAGGDAASPKVDFVRKVLQRYEDAKVLFLGFMFLIMPFC